MTADVPGQIEVGASGSAGDLRLWQAREAVRQGEARLTAQAQLRTALEGRATAITGWATASLVLAVGGAIAGPEQSVRVAAGIASLILFCAAGLCIHAARPSEWNLVGYDTTIVSTDRLATELEILEATAAGLSSGVGFNARRLEELAGAVRVSGWLMIATLPVGMLTLLLLRTSA